MLKARPDGATCTAQLTRLAARGVHVTLVRSDTEVITTRLVGDGLECLVPHGSPAWRVAHALEVLTLVHAGWPDPGPEGEDAVCEAILHAGAWARLAEAYDLADEAEDLAREAILAVAAGHARPAAHLWALTLGLHPGEREVMCAQLEHVAPECGAAVQALCALAPEAPRERTEAWALRARLDADEAAPVRALVVEGIRLHV